jgi:hypothetical protein
VPLFIRKLIKAVIFIGSAVYSYIYPLCAISRQTGSKRAPGRRREYATTTCEMSRGRVPNEPAWHIRGW